MSVKENGGERERERDDRRKEIKTLAQEQLHLHIGRAELKALRTVERIAFLTNKSGLLSLALI